MIGNNVTEPVLILSLVKFGILVWKLRCMFVGCFQLTYEALLVSREVVARGMCRCSMCLCLCHEHIKEPIVKIIL